MVLWKGPYRVTRFINPSVVEMENLLSGRKVEAHITRVKVYYNSSRHTKEELKELLEYQKSVVYRVDALQELVRERRIFKIRVSWLGFTGEDTWHNLGDIHHDVPELTLDFLRAHADKDFSQQAARKLGVKL